jgi:hypothetical protein
VTATTIWGNAARVRYFSGQVLGVSDFQAEQDYVRGKHRLLNRMTLGEGIVSGLDVTIDTTSSGNAPVISVAPGVAIAADGEALVLPQPVTCTLADASASGFVTLRYVERPVSPVQPAGTDTDTEAPGSRIEEGVALDFDTEIRDRSVRLARLVRGTSGWTMDPDFRPATSRHRAGSSSSEG